MGGSGGGMGIGIGTPMGGIGAGLIWAAPAGVHESTNKAPTPTKQATNGVQTERMKSSLDGVPCGVRTRGVAGLTPLDEAEVRSARGLQLAVGDKQSPSSTSAGSYRLGPIDYLHFPNVA